MDVLFTEYYQGG